MGEGTIHRRIWVGIPLSDVFSEIKDYLHQRDPSQQGRKKSQIAWEVDLPPVWANASGMSISGNEKAEQKQHLEKTLENEGPV